MEMTIRITGTRLIVGLILGVLLATILLLRAAMPGPNAVITNRSSFQALLLMPKELRAFPVEQYLAPGDWFIYRLSTKPNDRREWRLHIVSAVAEADKWKSAFLGYLEPRGQCIERRRSTLGPEQVQRVYFHSNIKAGVSGVVDFKSTEPSTELYITFAYYEPGRPNRLWGTKYGRLLASVLRRIGLPIDAVTQVS
jgi:hypothetical protein